MSLVVKVKADAVKKLNKENNAEEFNGKDEETSLSMMSTRYASNFINDLYERANVKDNRYLYF